MLEQFDPSLHHNLTTHHWLVNLPGGGGGEGGGNLPNV